MACYANLSHVQAVAEKRFTLFCNPGSRSREVIADQLSKHTSNIDLVFGEHDAVNQTVATPIGVQPCRWFTHYGLERDPRPHELTNHPATDLADSLHAAQYQIMSFLHLR